MACLAPQFKWPPSTSRLHHRTAFREPGRVRCAMTSSAVVEADRPASSSAPSGRHLGYAGAVGPPAPDTSTIPAKFEAALASSALLNEDAVVAAAAAEAVALARTAMEVAKEVAQMVETDHQPIIGREKTDDFLVKEIRRNEMQSSGLDTCANVTSGHTDDDFLEDAEFYSIMNNKCELDDERYTQSIAVKSARRSERRDWRARTAMKAAKTVSQKPTTCSKKKRLKGCRSPLGCFWKMTGRRLLTSKQEIEFSKGIQDLIKLEAIQTALAKYNGGQPTFSQWAEAAGLDEKTLRKRLDRGIYCKNRMVTSNVRLVISIAREFEGPGMELSDLIQEGMQGLIRGAEKFDASKGFRFSTYSHWWIKQAIRKSVLEQSQIIRLPAHMVEANYRVKECRRRLRAQLKRRPTNEEIALDTGIPLKRINAVVSLPKYTVSLDSKVGSTDLTYQEITADPSAETAEEMLNRWLMKKDVNRALDSLTVREKQVVRWRFGLDDGMLRTLHEIGQLMGVSRERIRQIESGAFRKLRNKKRVKSLKHYLEPVDNW